LFAAKSIGDKSHFTSNPLASSGLAYQNLQTATSATRMDTGGNDSLLHFLSLFVCQPLAGQQSP
jgi:hypothetical protein